ncbi:hypothetical protein ABUE31_06450 [Mesorhizobium sp. ZMM04-5]|uniref:DUF3426 domain-containing protein n=1 Tax=Mesorhizobium marinum TaxID=3228790 RepID=A0ABV3QX42_9HYPH
MADEVKPRAVSGEIMTGAGFGAEARATPADDVIDADFISLPAAAAHAGPATRAPVSAPAPVAPPAGRMDMLRGGGAREPRSRGPGGPLFWTTGIALVVAAFWVSGGHALLRDGAFAGAGQSGSALRISGVTSRVETSGVRPLLLIDGEAANDGRSTEHLPPLEIAVTGNDGLVTRYRLGTSGRPLAPGETFAFSSRLDAPKNGVKTVSVSFAE